MALRVAIGQPRSVSAAQTPIAIHGLSASELVEIARERVPRGHGRARDIYRQVTLEGRFAPEEHGLSAEACAAWRAAFTFDLPEIRSRVDEDGPSGTTSKVVLRSPEGLEYEMVAIPMGRGRTTLCISSQVGCKMGCTFCETAKMGLIRHLSAAEIVAQVLSAKYRLDWKVRNVVFMGMGEALDNAPEVIQALRVLNDPSGVAIGQERITVCTVGHLQGLTRLQAAGFKRLNLSLSLNATTDELRRELIPSHRRTSMSELQEVLASYRPRRNFTLGVNYILLPGINDSREDARRVAEFTAPIARVLINVIPYNPGSEPLTRAPEDEEIDTFIGWLRDEGVPVRKRVTKGRSVMAACGQLGNLELREKRRRGELVVLDPREKPAGRADS